MTVQEIADRYGVSATFLVQALAKIGCQGMKPDANVSAATVARFEKAFGDKIRAARPQSEPGSDSDQPRVVRREPKPHVMRVAHEHISGKRDMRTMVRYKVVADEPGPAHAIDAAGTREGDPWRGEEAPGANKFYDHQGPHAACGAQVKVVMGNAFDAEQDDACPKCAELVAAGKGFRTSPHERRSPFCDSFLRLRVDGRVIVEQCRLRDYHSGPHRTFDGATWDAGAVDYVPAPSG